MYQKYPISILLNLEYISLNWQKHGRCKVQIGRHSQQTKGSTSNLRPYKCQNRIRRRFQECHWENTGLQDQTGAGKLYILILLTQPRKHINDCFEY